MDSYSIWLSASLSRGAIMPNNSNQKFWLFVQACFISLCLGYFSPGLGFILFMVSLILYVSS